MNTRESFGNTSSHDKSVVLDCRKEIGIKVTNSRIDLRGCSSFPEIRNRGLFTKKDSLVVQGEKCF